MDSHKTPYIDSHQLDDFPKEALQTLKLILLSGQNRHATLYNRCLKQTIGYIESAVAKDMDPTSMMQYLFKESYASDKSFAKINLFNAALLLNKRAALTWLTENFVTPNEYHQAVREIAKSQTEESGRIFPQALRGLKSSSGNPVLVTELLSLIVGSAASYIQNPSVTQDECKEYEDLAIKKLNILFAQSKIPFGWPGNLIDSVESQEELPIYLEEKYFKLREKLLCYPI
ncbi:hypothetical protein N7540_012496 [Penicillium herquei]|nr:hypothetical protein N7540_012496 [Penicillium herquei]